MAANKKYTKEVLEPVVRSSSSYAEVIRKLGIRWSGGTQQNIRRWVMTYQIDVTHFLGQAANRGVTHRGGSNKKPWNEVLVYEPNRSWRVDACKLRRALIDSGVPYQCSTCGNPGEWNGKELRLQVDHKNGDWRNNTPGNVRFQCPNCHSQTENWSGSKGLSSVTSTAAQSRERRRKAAVAKLADASV